MRDDPEETMRAAAIAAMAARLAAGGSRAKRPGPPPTWAAAPPPPPPAWHDQPAPQAEAGDPWLDVPAWTSLAQRHWRSAALILLMSGTGFAAVLVGQSPVLHKTLAAFSGAGPHKPAAKADIVTQLAETARPAVPDDLREAPPLRTPEINVAVLAEPEPVAAPVVETALGSQPMRLASMPEEAPPPPPPWMGYAPLAVPPPLVLHGEEDARPPPPPKPRPAPPVLAVAAPARLPPIPVHNAAQRPPLVRAELAMFTAHLPAAHAIRPGLPRWLTDPAPKPRRVLIMSEAPHNLSLPPPAPPPAPEIAAPPYVGASYPYASPYARASVSAAGQSWYRSD